MNSFMTFYQVVLALLFAPLAMGLVKFFKARFQGRLGASPFLPYFTLLTLLKKQMVISKSTSWVFRLAPFIVLGTTFFLILVLPLIRTSDLFAPFSHFVIVAGVLMLGAIFLVLGGLESASAFGGMGACREMTIASLMEPTALLIFATLALSSGSAAIDQMIFQIDYANHPFILLTLLALIFLTLAENARYPVDNPATHLELTMVHEAMVLEYSGPYLAMLEYASALKLTIFSLLLANFIWPIGVVTAAPMMQEIFLAPVFLLLKLIVMMFLLALLESTIVKMRFYRINEYVSISFFLALAGIILTLVNKVL